MAAPSKVNAAPKKKKSDAKDLSLPKGWAIQIRWNNRDGSQLFIERAPHQELITLSEAGDYYVWMPWTYYLLDRIPSDTWTKYEQWRLRGLYVSPVKVSEDSDLYKAPLTNLYYDTKQANPCYAGYADDMGSFEAQVAEAIRLWEAEDHNWDDWDSMRHLSTYQALADLGKPDDWEPPHNARGCDCCEPDAVEDFCMSYDSLPHAWEAWEKLSLKEVRKLPWEPITTVRKLVGSDAKKFLRPGVKAES